MNRFSQLSICLGLMSCLLFAAASARAAGAPVTGPEKPRLHPGELIVSFRAGAAPPAATAAATAREYRTPFRNPWTV